MLITVKILKGGECTIEVGATSSVSFVKQLVAQQLQIPVCQQRLVFKGRTLLDNDSLCDYNIVEGNKLFLFISDEAGPVSSNLLWDRLQKLLEKHFAHSDATKVVEEFKKNFKEKLANMSLDDIEKLAKVNISSDPKLQKSSS